MKDESRTADNGPVPQPAPSGWQTTTLGTICLPVQKVRPHDEPEHWFAYLDIASIDNTKCRIVSPKTYSGANAPSRARQRVRGGNTLFSTVRTYLKNIAMVPPEFDGQVASTGFCVLNPADEIDPRFVFYHTVSDGFISVLNPLQRGTSYPAVRDDDVLAQRIDLPPLPEQHRIVAEIEKQFTRLDASVAALRRTQANLKRYRASVLRAACSGELVPTEAELARAEGREYEPADVLLERILVERRARWGSQENRRGKYKEPSAPDTSDLPLLPEGWTWATLDSCLAGIQAGKNFKCEERPPSETEYGVVKVSSVTWGEFNGEESKTCHDLTKIEPSLQIKPGDFLFSRANTLQLVGACVIARSVTRNLMLSDKILRFSVVEVLNEWLLYCLRSALGRSEIERLATGNQQSMRNIGQDRIRQIRLPLPPLAEQRRIVTEVERRLLVIQQAGAAVEASLQRAERLRQSILKRAFAGELVPQDPDDEPASVLLERIRAQREAEQAAASAAKKRPTRRRRSNPKATQSDFQEAHA